MSIQSFFGVISLATSVIGLLPQIYKSLKTRSTHDVSMVMLINYLICSFAWIVYGSYTASTFVLWSNIIGGASSVLLIVIKLNFDKKQEDYASTQLSSV